MKLIRSQLLVGATLLAKSSAAQMPMQAPNTVMVQAAAPMPSVVTQMAPVAQPQQVESLSDGELMNMMSQLSAMQAAAGRQDDGKGPRAIAQPRTQQTVSSLTTNPAAEPAQVIIQPATEQFNAANATVALASLASAPHLEAIQVKNLGGAKLPDQKAVTAIAYQTAQQATSVPTVSQASQIDQVEAMRQVQLALGLEEVYQTDRADKLQTAQREQLLKNATAAIEGLIHLRAAKRLQQADTHVAVSAQATMAAAAKAIVPDTKAAPTPVTVQLAPIPQVVMQAPVKPVVLPNQSLLTQPSEVASIVSQSSVQAVAGETSEEEKLNVLSRYYQTLQGKVEQQKIALAEARNHATRLVNQAFARPASAAKRDEVPQRDKVVDFLSSLGKIASMLLAVTPLPTYLGTWGKSKKEQVERVNSISFTYLLLQILNNCIWTSYAFKTQNIDLAIISVVPLIIAIILTCIYLCVKPESSLMSQFLAMLLLCQIFNFDLLSTSVSGALGTLVSILGNLIGLSFVPEVIESRDTRAFNMPLTYINIFNLTIWFSYALLKLDPFMSLSQGLGLLFNVIQAMFYHWAKGRINAHDTPSLWIPMRALISFFNLFVVKQKLGEIQALFWADESSLQAQFYMKTYQKDIEAMEEKYADSEKTYEQHMADMQKLNSKLENISSGKYDAYIKRLAAKNEEIEQHRPSYEAAASSNGSTHAGSSDFAKESPRGTAERHHRASHEYNEHAHHRHWNGQAYDQHAMAYMQQQPPFGYPPHAQWQGPQNYGPGGDDSISMTSFNSSMNFTRLQNSINFRAGVSNQSQSTNYFRSRLQNVNPQPNYYMHQMNVNPMQEHATVGQHQVYERQMMPNYNGDESTLMLDDIAGVPGPVTEACAEDEQSSRNISRGLISQAQAQPRSSVLSIISAIQSDDQEQHELKEMHYIQPVNEASEQRLCASIDMKSLGATDLNIPRAPPILNKSSSGVVRDQREIVAQAEKAIERNQQALTQFFNAEEKPPQLPTEDNAAVVGGREEDEQQRLLAVGGTGEDAQRSSEGNSSQLLNTSEFANAVSVSGMAHELQVLAAGNNSMEDMMTAQHEIKKVNHSMTEAAPAQQQNTSSSGNSSSGVLAGSGSFVNQTGEKDLTEVTAEIPLQRMD